MTAQQLKVDILRQWASPWWWGFVPGTIGMLVFVASLSAGWSIGTLVWGLIAQVVLSGAAIALGVQFQRRPRSKVVGVAGRVCIHCKYLLVDLRAPGVCPECGRPFPDDAHASVWREAGVL